MIAEVVDERITSGRWAAAICAKGRWDAQTAAPGELHGLWGQCGGRLHLVYLWLLANRKCAGQLENARARALGGKMGCEFATHCEADRRDSAEAGLQSLPCSVV